MTTYLLLHPLERAPVIAALDSCWSCACSGTAVGGVVVVVFTVFRTDTAVGIMTVTVVHLNF